VLINSPDIDILVVVTTSSTRTRFRNVPCGFSNKLINTFVLPQFDGPQMIPHIEIGSISMFAYFFFSLYFIVDISHFDREFHIFSLHDTDNIEKNDIENIFIVARKAKVFKMLLIVYRRTTVTYIV